MWIKVSNPPVKEPELLHYGVKDMKWYHRRYQNEDGSLTERGRIHYGVGTRRERRAAEKEYVTAEKNREKWAKMTEAERYKRTSKMTNKQIKARKKAEEQQAKEEARKEAEAKKAEQTKAETEKTEQAKTEEKSTKENTTQESKSVKVEAKQNTNQNEKSKAEEVTNKVRKATSSLDYTSAENALDKGAKNFERNANLVGMLDQARRNNKVSKAIGKRELKKPISEMTDKEINDQINRWAQEERLAQMSVGQKSQAAENVQTALRVMGNITATAGGVMGIASSIRSIYERR